MDLEGLAAAAPSAAAAVAGGALVTQNVGTNSMNADPRQVLDATNRVKIRQLELRLQVLNSILCTSMGIAFIREL